MIKDRNIADDAQIAMHKVLGAFYPQAHNTYALYVDYDNGNDGDTGRSPKHALQTIQKAVDKAARGWTIFVFSRYWGAVQTDPYNYAETISIPLAKSNLRIIGVPCGRTQGGLPQVKINTGSTALLTINAPGCLIANMGFNGINSTGGGILMDCDAGATKTAFGTAIYNCHFKNCVGSTATNAATGGAIMWSANGGSWQVHIKGNRFYKNVGDVVLIGTSNSRPQDVIIEDNVFSGPAANTDCNLYLAGGSGMNGVIIKDNFFTAMPALGGTNDRFMDLTGCVGMLANNYFATTVDPALTELTFAAAGTAAKVPSTVFMAGNQGEVQATGNTSNHAAIGRYA